MAKDGSKYDLVVIGGGPGGYPAAIRAVQLGKRVAIIDKGTFGGECLHWGCIPSKSLISAANLYHKLQHDAALMGITADNVQINMSTLRKWKISVQDKLVGGIKMLLKKHKITTIYGTASFANRNQVQVDLNEGGERIIDFDQAIVATGARFISLPGFEIDEESVLSAKGLLDLDTLPEELIVIGGGIIGLELGTVFAKFGVKVRIVELTPQLMTGVNPQMVRYVEKTLRKLDVEIFTESRALNYVNKKGKLHLQLQTKNGEKTLTGDKILLSVGKVASTKGLGLEKVGVKLDGKGFIEVDEQLRTNINHIFAVGDITGTPFLAHRATKQGMIAAEVIAGKNSVADYKSIPTAIYTDPEIASTGMSEEEAKAAGYTVVIGQATFAASGRAMTQQEEEGFARVISDADDGVILGVEIVGPHASDLISEATLAIEMGATVEDLGFTVHPHPSLPEMLMEAADAIEGKAIHVPNTRRK